MAARQQGGDDALAGLLALSGMDTSAFSRPRSLADMKQTHKPVQGTPVQASAGVASGAPTGTPPLGPPARPAGSPLRPPLPSHAPASPDPPALDQLLATSRPAQPAHKSASLGSFSSSAAAADGGSQADLNAFFSQAGAGMPAAAQPAAPAPALSANSDPFFSTPAPAAQRGPQVATRTVPPPSPEAGSDPWDLLGAPEPARPAAQPAAAAPAAPASGLGDLLGGDLLGGFEGVPGAAAAKPAAKAAQRPAAPKDEEAAAGAPGGARHPSPAPRARTPPPAAPAAAAKPTCEQRDGVGAAAAAAPAAASPEGPGAPAFAGQSAPVPPPRASPGHRVFEVLDQHEGAGSYGGRHHTAGDSWGAHGGTGESAYGAGLLGAPPRRGGDAAATAAEVKQKAAKMLHAGTQWFMKASKTLVRDLQTSMAKHQQHGGGAAGASSGSGIPPYYYDWAAQLARLSPGSRSAALGAMGEDDRLAVQRIMDEAALGERYMEQQAGPEDGCGDASYPGPAGQQARYGGGGGRERGYDQGQQHQQQFQHRRPPPPPPAGPPEAAAPARPPSGMGSRHSSRGVLDPEPQASVAPEPAPGGGQPRDAAAAATTPAAEPPAARVQANADFLGFDGSPAPAAPAAAALPAAGAPAAAAPSSAGGAAGEEEDLLGFGSGAAGAARPAPAAPAAAAGGGGGGDLEDDLLGLHGSRPSAAAGAAAAAVASPARDQHIEDLFTVRPPAGAAAAARPAAAGAAQGPAAVARRAPAAPRSPLDSMIDLEEAVPDVDVGDHVGLYEEGEEEAGDPNEPEIRKALRQKRIREKHRRMQQQLAEKRAREQAEAAEKAGKVELREQLKPRIDAWAAGKKDNIRALLSSLHTVLWEGSGWTAPQMSDMVDEHKVKRIYMKANLIVHPDKVKQKGGTLEQITIADMVFDVLKMAWGKSGM